MVILDLLGTAFLAIVPFVVGAAAGFYRPQYRLPFLVITGVPAGYFTVNLLAALARQGLNETLLVGIKLGNSPVFIMLLTAVTAGPFLGFVAGSWWRTR